MWLGIVSITDLENDSSGFPVVYWVSVLGTTETSKGVEIDD